MRFKKASVEDRKRFKAAICDETGSYAAYFKFLKDGYIKPTAVLRDPDTGHLTSNVSDLHNIFKSEWCKKVYNKEEVK